MLAQAQTHTLIDELLAEQQQLTAVDLFSLRQERNEFKLPQRFYHQLLPTRQLERGEQYAFQVDLDSCSGCKACVTACHNRNGLEEGESWREVGLLHSAQVAQPFLQTVTTACHHCVDPACLEGCPVLAYDKDPVTGIVRHLDDQCIGCQYCVMKCPYEVPKYSERLGIVRKCDMCANRLATGEAPACAQACPSGAIQISIVNQADVRALFAPPQPDLRAQANPFLPDSPNPQITLPTTRFVSQRGLPADAIAADHAVLRLDHAHWPLNFMLVLTQAAAGIFLGGSCVAMSPSASAQWPLQLTGFTLLCAGLTISTFHLGQPLKAWRAFLGWRTSWLSREIIAFALLALLAAGAIVAPGLPFFASGRAAFAWATTGAAFLAVATSVMVYVDTRRPLWAPGFVCGNFFGTTLLLGASVSAAVLGGCGASSQSLAAAAGAALLLRTVLFAWRRLTWSRAWRDPDSPFHFSARIVRQLLPWTVRAQSMLFIASTLFSVLTVISTGWTATLWAALAAVTTIAAEIVARYVFFAAGASQRMPGGIGA